MAENDEQSSPNGEDNSPLGDTEEAHDELHPVDLPPGHPSQGELKRRMEEGEEMPGIPSEGKEPPNSG